MSVVYDYKRNAAYDPAARMIEPDDARHFGRKIYLRPLVAADVTERYVSWFDDPDVTYFLEAKNIKAEETLEMLASFRTHGDQHLYAVCDMETHQHVGNAKIGWIRWKHGYGDLVTVIGERAAWGKGIGAEAVAMTIRLAFQVYGLRKLTAYIYESNRGSYHAYTRGGFVEEAVLRGHQILHGKVQDAYIVSAFNPEFFPDSTFPATLERLGLPPL